MNCAYLKPSLQEEFFIFRSKILLEQRFRAIHESRIQDSNKIDILKLVKYEKHLHRYNSLLKVAAEAAMLYWKELASKSVDAKALQQRGLEVSLSYEKISALASRLSELSPNDVKFFLSYGAFLKEVINNDIDAQIYLERAYNYNNN